MTEKFVKKIFITREELARMISNEIGETVKVNQVEFENCHQGCVIVTFESTGSFSPPPKAMPREK